jgi:hypothetical protein
MLTTKREKIKGHYRLVTRDNKGRFVTSEKWSPLMNKGEQCPRCKHYTLKPMKGELIDGKHRLWLCSRCHYKAIRKAEESKDA